MNRKKLLMSLAMAMLSMAGLAADNLPALRVQGKNLVDANGKTVDRSENTGIFTHPG